MDLNIFIKHVLTNFPIRDVLHMQSQIKINLHRQGL
jgi:hypothetical protein